MIRNGRWLVAGVLAALVWCLVPATAAWAQLQVHEILGDPATDWDGDGEVDFKGDEWVEIINLGTETVVLDDYWLRDALGDDPHMRLAGELAGGAVLVVYGSDALAWQAANGNGSSGLSLNNGGDTVVLLYGPAVDDLTVVDEALYLDHEAEDDRSSGRLFPEGTWALFDGLNPYDGLQEPLSTLCDPTPGAVNDCVPFVAVDRHSWTDLKRYFDQ